MIDILAVTLNQMKGEQFQGATPHSTVASFATLCDRQLPVTGNLKIITYNGVCVTFYRLVEFSDGEELIPSILELQVCHNARHETASLSPSLAWLVCLPSQLTTVGPGRGT